MPFTISLLDAIVENIPRRLWPRDFEPFAKSIEEDPTDRAQLGIVADWLDEHDEPMLARAFRLTRKRGVMLEKSEYGYWRYTDGLPWAVLSRTISTNADTNSPLGAIAELALKLRAAIEELESIDKDELPPQCTCPTPAGSEHSPGCPSYDAEAKAEVDMVQALAEKPHAEPVEF